MGAAELYLGPDHTCVVFRIFTGEKITLVRGEGCLFQELPASAMVPLFPKMNSRAMPSYSIYITGRELGDKRAMDTAQARIQISGIARQKASCIQS